jgi:hypothetical protein
MPATACEIDRRFCNARGMTCQGESSLEPAAAARATARQGRGHGCWRDGCFRVARIHHAHGGRRRVTASCRPTVFPPRTKARLQPQCQLEELAVNPGRGGQYRGVRQTGISGPLPNASSPSDRPATYPQSPRSGAYLRRLRCEAPATRA